MPYIVADRFYVSYASNVSNVSNMSIDGALFQSSQRPPKACYAACGFAVYDNRADTGVEVGR